MLLNSTSPAYMRVIRSISLQDGAIQLLVKIGEIQNICFCREYRGPTWLECSWYGPVPCIFTEMPHCVMQIMSTSCWRCYSARWFMTQQSIRSWLMSMTCRRVFVHHFSGRTKQRQLQLSSVGSATESQLKSPVEVLWQEGHPDGLHWLRMHAGSVTQRVYRHSLLKEWDTAWREDFLPSMSDETRLVCCAMIPQMPHSAALLGLNGRLNDMFYYYYYYYYYCSIVYLERCILVRNKTLWTSAIRK